MYPRPFPAPIDVRGRDGPAQDRVFREILEIPAIQGVTEQIHTRSQDHVGPHIQGFLPYCVAHPERHLPVPGGRREQAGGKAGAEMGLSQSVVPVRLQAHAHGAVHHHHGRNAVFLKGMRKAAGSRKGGRIAFAGAVEAHHQQGLFLRAHRFHNLRNVVRVQLRLRRKDGCRKQAAQGEGFGFHSGVI